jgi:ketosteroid isomerase-like protein
MKMLRYLVILGLALSSSIFSPRAAEQSILVDRLKPLQWLLGNWEIRENDSGRIVAKIAVTHDVEGSIVNLRYDTYDDGGRNVFFGRETYFWQAESKTIGMVGFVSDGGHSSGVLSKCTDDRLVWQNCIYGADFFGTQVFEFTKIDANTMELQFTHRVFAGEPQSNFPESKAVFKRVLNNSEEKEIIKLNENWNNAYIKRDLVALERILADDFYGISDEGEVTNKQNEIASTKSGDLVLTSYVCDEPVKVHVYGNTAVATTYCNVKLQNAGKDRSGQFRETIVWIKRDNRWQVASWQSTRAKKN